MVLVVTPTGQVVAVPDEVRAACLAEVTAGAWKVKRITTVPQGSWKWKWQKAYAVKEYRLTKFKSGKVAWQAFADITDKLSWPQLRQLGYGDLRYGALHNKPAIAVFK